jgi:hypothetical protein
MAHSHADRPPTRTNKAYFSHAAVGQLVSSRRGFRTVWRNSLKADDGPREVRSVTFNPRRYKDRETGEWKDSNSFRQSDLPVLMLALQCSWQHMTLHPLPQAAEPDEEGTPF